MIPYSELSNRQKKRRLENLELRVATTSPSDLAVAGPSDLTVAGPSDLAVAGPSDLAVAGPSDLAVAGPSDLAVAFPSDLAVAFPSDLAVAGPSDLAVAGPSDMAVAGPSDMAVAGPSDMAVAGPSDIAIAGPLNYAIAGPPNPNFASDGLSRSSQIEDSVLSLESIADIDSLNSDSKMVDIPLSTEQKIETAIVNWIDECPNVPTQHVYKLLKHLNSFFPDIPLTPKTLLKENSMKVTISKMFHGSYAHFDEWILCSIKFLEFEKFVGSEISLHVNVDGIPLFNDSRNYHAYPILVQIASISPRKIFCAGIYVSENLVSNKMPPVNCFLKQFIDDLLLICNNGLTVSNKTVKVRIGAFICDAPARADLKKIVGHSGYFSCERCIQKGVIAAGHVALVDCESVLRSDESFNSQYHSEHHKDGPPSIISQLEIGMVRQFPLDYMHMCCLGVMKRLLGRWKGSKKSETKCNLSSQHKTLLDEKLLSYSEHVPSEFKRKLNSGFSNFQFWKATEFRQFILYAGIALMHDLLPHPLYLNFLYFAVSMRVLLDNNQEGNLSKVEFMLKKFVKGARKLYGDGFISYNVHSIIHLPEDYHAYGSLNNVSCFPFENYLGCYIKGRLTGRNKPLQQICRHVSNENAHLQPSVSPYVDKVGKYFYKDGKKFSKGPSVSKDNGIITYHGMIGFITAFNDEEAMITEMHQTVFFDLPCNSTDVGIFKLKLSTLHKKILKSEIESKLIIVPNEDHFVGMKML